MSVNDAVNRAIRAGRGERVTISAGGTETGMAFNRWVRSQLGRGELVETVAPDTSQPAARVTETPPPGNAGSGTGAPAVRGLTMNDYIRRAMGRF